MKFEWFRKKIKRKIALTLVTIPALVAIFIVIITQSIASESLLLEKKNSLKTAVFAESAHLKQIFNTSSDLAESISETQRARDFFGGGERAEDVPNIIYNLSGLSYIGHVHLVNLEGVVVASHDKKGVGEDISQTNRFEAIKSGKEFFHELDFNNKSVNYYVIKRVTNSSNTILGYVELIVNPELALRDLDKTSLSEVGSVFLFNTEGMFLYANNQKLVFHSIWDIQNEDVKKLATDDAYKDFKFISRKNTKAKEHLANYYGPEFFDYYCVNEETQKTFFFSRVGDYPLYLGATIKPAEIRANLLVGANIITLLSTLAIILGATLVTVLLFRYLRPLKNIQKALESINNNHLEQDMNIKTIDEFSEIEKVLMSIAEKLNNKNCKECLAREEETKEPKSKD